MVRKRVLNTATNGTDHHLSPHPNNSHSSSNPNKHLRPFYRRPKIIVATSIAIALGALTYVGVSHYLVARWVAEVVTKADLPLASSSAASSSMNEHLLKWGTHRSHLYFGLCHHHPQSPLMGLGWYKQPRTATINNLPLRHWAEQGDDVRFMWDDADGKTFGHQSVRDGRLSMSTDWINHGHSSWSARLELKGLSNNSHAFLIYFAVQDPSTRLDPVHEVDPSINQYQILRGSSPLFGEFSLGLKTLTGSTSTSTKKDPVLSYVHFGASAQPNGQLMDMKQVNNLVLSSLRRDPNGDLLLDQNPAHGTPSDHPSFIAVQITLQDDSVVEINYVTEGDDDPPPFEEEFNTRLSSFRSRFNDIFPIPTITSTAIGDVKPELLSTMARSALSNMLGSIGVWHGFSLVRSNLFPEGKVLPYGPLSLISAVPSRTTFPRGFIWDEGFHNLLIRQFDPSLSIDIIASWLDTMNMAGWMPREMILGREAQARVPSEFLVQSDSVANPPMFFYLIDKFMHDPEFMVRYGSRLRQLYPRLKLWYQWLKETQAGPVTGSFRWRGRNATTIMELNPKTLASGLDDFPRASHPSPDEYHLDLRCWMAIAAKVLRRLAEHAADTKGVVEVEEEIRLFADPQLLDKLHWSERTQRYHDYGHHSTSVKLATEEVVGEGTGGVHSRQSPPQYRYVRKVLSPPVLQHVEDANGYVSLYPLLLKLIPADSPKLPLVLKGLKDPNEMWSPYGLRSVSKRSPYYNARNTEHDPPYWRGNIWININYLALDALKHYSLTVSNGEVAKLCADTYTQLRLNLINTVVGEYKKNGFIWENYNDATGEGQGTRPFTGWSALILSILAEKYD